MKAKVNFVKTASPFLMTANEEQASAAGFAVDFQELCAREMDLALGIHKASLDSAVSLHSCAIEMCEAIDICNQASCFTEVFGTYFGTYIDAATKSFALCMELHRCWLTIAAPYALPYDIPFAGGFGHQAVAASDELAYHMDLAIGEQSFAADEFAVSSADLRAAPAAQEEETDRDEMDIAVGSRAA
jgi:hypothetical protein